MKFTYQLVDNDYIEYYKFSTKYNPSIKRRLLLVRIICPLFLLLVTYYALRDIEASVTKYVFYGVVVALALAILLFYKQFSILLLQRKRKKLRKAEKITHNQELSCEFLEDSFIISAQGAETMLEYSMIRKISFSASAFYLFVGAQTVYILPFRVFTGDSERNEFIAFIQSKQISKPTTQIT